MAILNKRPMKILCSLFIILLLSCKSNFSKNKKINIDKKFNSKVIHNNYNSESSLLSDKWYADHKTENEIIIATLDSQIDLNHEDLQGHFWINKNEIANNGIDDDQNGYIDDINGWNFIGHKNKSFDRYRNFEFTRIVNSKDEYLNANIKFPEDSLLFLKEYFRAENKLQKEQNFHKNWFKSLEYSFDNYKKAKDTLKYFFPKENYNYMQLDSLYNIYKTNDKSFKQRRNESDNDLGALINIIMISVEMEIKQFEDLQEQKNQIDSIINRNLNIHYADRKLISDSLAVLKNGYGNNRLNENTYQLGHNSAVSSIIAANRNNNIGTQGFHQNIRIMPLCISGSGDEHDKDIAMAIYYAVDNGAKIINMSFGKEFSLRQDWVSDAMVYAEKHKVLIVHSSGNNRFNVDKNSYYPSDVDYLREKKEELVSNFINVGSISKRTDSTMVSKFSNYGKQNVDIFAPGEEIYVAKPGNKYGYDSGTSLAGPMVSGTAALMWLYYPKLTVQEVKSIILESGVTINQKVIKPGTENEMVPFSELCKSGKILNTYNAMKMAEKISKYKK